MTPLSIQPPYPVIPDADGQPLENGYIWIGSAGLDPQSNPVTAYFDAALTIVAAQPIRTKGGYPVYQGAPARLYINGTNYSIRVMNKNGLTVYTALNIAEVSVPVDNSVTTAKLADNSVTTAKLADNSVTSAKLGSSSVTNPRLAPNAVTAAKIERVAANQVLRSTGVSSNPVWGPLDLTTDVTGTLPVARGGTGVTSSTGSGSVVLADSPTFTADVVINGIEAGRGAGNIATNTAFGNDALAANTSGFQNTAFGNDALAANTSGTLNTALGNSALAANTTGGSNVGIGNFAGAGITTGGSNTFVGAGTIPSAAGVVNEVIVGASLGGKGNNTAFIGGTSGAYNAKNVTTWETTSDLRLKKDVTDNKEGLEHILAIRVRNFKYRTQEEITELPIKSAVDKQGVQLGVIAQEMREVLPSLVTENSTGVLSLNTDPLLWYLINSVQSLKAELEQTKARVAALEAK